jgi:hypothetical protein
MGAALFGRNIPRHAWAGALGGVAPDVTMIATVLVLKLFGISDMIIFGFLYWQPWWQIANAISHNVWLWGGGLLLAIVMRERQSLSAAHIDAWSLPAIFCASALLHTVIDFLVHREDGHMSFWPVSYWRFMSPVSYWDSAHYGSYFQVFETSLGLALAGLLYASYKHRLARILLLAMSIPYLALPVYFAYSLAG